MNINFFLGCCRSLLYPVLSVLILVPSSQVMARPNVVLIMADDMGYECVASNGGQETYQTPSLDALAQSGMRFTNAHSQPICTPSRVQIMTGIYNNRNYIKFGLLDPDARTFGHLFRDAGYKTCIVGKWQLSGGMNAPSHFGFDEYCLWQLDRRPPRYSNPGLEINGRKVDYFNGEFGPDIVSDYLCDFIQKNKSREFFAYYPMILPHYPFVPTPDSPEYDRTQKEENGIGDPRFFPGMVAHVDKIVGKIVRCLNDSGIREKTLVLFTGDNGTHFRITSQFRGVDYPGGKGSTTDNGTHVPMIASWPGTIPSGMVNANLVDFSDILPTMADAAGLAVPERWDIDGLSFTDQLMGSTGPHRHWIYCWYHRNGVREEASQHVRNEHYKLYRNGDLFNTRDDLLERKRLISGPLL